MNQPITAQIAMRTLNLPTKARICLWGNYLTEAYDKSPDKTEFFRKSCKPSQERYVKYLRVSTKVALSYVMEAPYDTMIPDVGYKTRHARTKEDVYVLQVSMREGIGRDASREQDYVKIIKTFNTDFHLIKPTRDLAFKNTCMKRDAPWRYLDTLTKKQKQALIMLRIAPPGTYIEGIGVTLIRRRGVWNPEKSQHDWIEIPHYYIDAIKEE